MEPVSETAALDEIPPSRGARRRLVGLGVVVLLATILTGYLSGVRVHVGRGPLHRLALSLHDTVTITLEQRFEMGTRWRDLGGRHLWRELKASYRRPGSGGAAEARIVLAYVAPFADKGHYDMVAIEQRTFDQTVAGFTLSRMWRFD